jgi:glutaredoxin
MKYILYSKDNCKFCNYARILLDLHGADYREFKPGEVNSHILNYEKFTPPSTYPKIFCVIDDYAVLIGGYAELEKHFERT